MSDTMERELISAGFVRDPNHYDSWYAGGPGIMEPCWPFRIILRAEWVALAIQPYGKFNPGDYIDVLRFANVTELIVFLSRRGHLSEPGLPAFSNAWD